MSDHLPFHIFVGSKDKQETIPRRKTIQTRNLNEHNIGLINEALQNYNWDVIENMTIDNAYEHIVNTVKTILDDIAPIVEKRIKVKSNYINEWVTKGILVS